MTIKFIYSEKATNFCEISTLLLSYVVPVKSKVEISHNSVVFSEYMNFTDKEKCLVSEDKANRIFSRLSANAIEYNCALTNTQLHCVRAT